MTAPTLAPVRLLRPAEVSELTGHAVQTLANMRYLNQGPRFVRSGRSVFYRSDDIAEWIDSLPTFGGAE